MATKHCPCVHKKRTEAQDRCQFYLSKSCLWLASAQYIMASNAVELSDDPQIGPLLPLSLFIRKLLKH